MGPLKEGPYQYTLYKYHLPRSDVMKGMISQDSHHYCGCIPCLKSIRILNLDGHTLCMGTRYIMMLHKIPHMPPTRQYWIYLTHHPQGWKPCQKAYNLDNDLDPMPLYHKGLLLWIPRTQNPQQ